MTGALYTLVDAALLAPRLLDQTVIETDEGQMFCRYEIADIGMLASRPKH